MWDLPGPGLEPVSPALAGRLLTIVPPGKSPVNVFFCSLVAQKINNPLSWLCCLYHSIWKWTEHFQSQHSFLWTSQMILLLKISALVCLKYFILSLHRLFRKIKSTICLCLLVLSFHRNTPYDGRFRSCVFLRMIKEIWTISQNYWKFPICLWHSNVFFNASKSIASHLSCEYEC